GRKSAGALASAIVLVDNESAWCGTGKGGVLDNISRCSCAFAARKDEPKIVPGDRPPRACCCSSSSQRTSARPRGRLQIQSACKAGIRQNVNPSSSGMWMKPCVINALQMRYKCVTKMSEAIFGRPCHRLLLLQIVRPQYPWLRHPCGAGDFKLHPDVS